METMEKGFFAPQDELANSEKGDLASSISLREFTHGFPPFLEEVKSSAGNVFSKTNTLMFFRPLFGSTFSLELTKLLARGVTTNSSGFPDASMVN